MRVKHCPEYVQFNCWEEQLLRLEGKGFVTREALLSTYRLVLRVHRSSKSVSSALAWATRVAQSGERAPLDSTLSMFYFHLFSTWSVDRLTRNSMISADLVTISSERLFMLKGDIVRVQSHQTGRPTDKSKNTFEKNRFLTSSTKLSSLCITVPPPHHTVLIRKNE